MQSIGVMIAAALIWYNPEWHIADPICTFIFSILVLFTTLQIMNQVWRLNCPATASCRLPHTRSAAATGHEATA